MMLLENITHQTIILSEMKATPFRGHHTGGILTTMLENC